MRDIRDSFADIFRAKEIGYERETSLEDGLAGKIVVFQSDMT